MHVLLFEIYQSFLYLKISFGLMWLKQDRVGEEGLFWHYQKSGLSSIFFISGFEKLQKPWRVCGSESD